MSDHKFLRGDFKNIIDQIIRQTIACSKIGKPAAIITAESATGTQPYKPAAVLVNSKNIIIYQPILDIVPAIEIGARSVWAKYGTSFEKKNFETLMTINCWEDAEVRKQYGEHGITPEFTIQHIAELREIICNP